MFVFQEVTVVYLVNLNVYTLELWSLRLKMATDCRPRFENVNPGKDYAFFLSDP